ncbi:hypothetical protein PGTUg99_008380 [Puccinia graminis f. sp. tritici]|nr:hypothetical protein, variant [Puccinia graminis f. sp. tritici CRL 75-36-700-3]EHS64485.1 hypothetical protein, variant [Puccinia graminis f. sp. tritici CRL 75-36-700-3]KAA1134869.1 hypothetical protein PGTUg99_008380 [Puccinia graminis f. sp. tritici]
MDSGVKPLSNNKTMSRLNSHAPAQNDSGHRLPAHATHRPGNPIGSQAAPTGVITSKQLQELQHRHQMQLALVKQEARELKEEKAFLVAQNLRLERELCLQNQPNSHGMVDPRRAELSSRPSFNRSRSHPNADFRDPLHSLTSNSPTYSGSSCSSHPWASSGGPTTPSSLSPRSRHSRNASSASLTVPTSHALPPMSRRPSLSNTGLPATSAPDPALLLQRLRLADRQQKMVHSQNVLNPLRPLSVASNACDEVRAQSSRSNPGSRGHSRRNSLSGSGSDQPLKGILKPSTPMRPVSSCSNTIVGPPTRPPSRPSTGMGYYVDEAYDSITRPSGQRTSSSIYNQQFHHSSIPQHRSRRGSLDVPNGERPKFNHGCNC